MLKWQVDSHSSTDQGGKGVRDQITGKQDGVSESQFPPGVPLREDQKGPRQKGGLDESEEESGSDHSTEIVDDTRESRDKTPKEHLKRSAGVPSASPNLWTYSGGDVPTGSGDLVDDHVGWDLESVSMGTTSYRVRPGEELTCIKM